ncbi:hypothetical protein ABT120_16070 [Nonomuraea angiospora]
MDTDDWLADTRTSYDAVAVTYADYVRGAFAAVSTFARPGHRR